MKIQCFADDPREPDLIGETMVDLTEVLTKGETDGKCLTDNFLSLLTCLRTEWFTLMNKDKYCGEVYLELTFWSNVRTIPYSILFGSIRIIHRSGLPRKRSHLRHLKTANNMLALAILFRRGSYRPLRTVVTDYDTQVVAMHTRMIIRIPCRHLFRPLGWIFILRPMSREVCSHR
jgi:hypothetical protein